MIVTEIKLGGVLQGYPEQKMFVCNSSGGKALISKDAPHSHYCLERPDIHVELAAFSDICKIVGEVSSVLELFGGSGWHSSIIQTYSHPAKHVALDIEQDCVQSIRMSLPYVTALQRDSYVYLRTIPPREWTWIHADFNKFTFHRYVQNKRYREALERIFQGSSHFVTLTDSAVFGLCRFARNRVAYKDVIGMDPEDWRDYYRAVSEVYQKRFGFGTRLVLVWQKMAAMLLLERGRTNDITIMEMTNKYPIEIVGGVEVDSNWRPNEPAA